MITHIHQVYHCHKDLLIILRQSMIALLANQNIVTCMFILIYSITQVLCQQMAYHPRYYITLEDRDRQVAGGDYGVCGRY